MKTTKFFTILSMTIIMAMPSLSSAQEFYLWADFIPGNSENAYFEDWTLCWSWGVVQHGTMHPVPAMGEQIPTSESIVLSASEFKDPTFSFTLQTIGEGGLAQFESYYRDKKKFPVKLALCNTKGEPEAMFLLSNAKISSYEENDDKLDLAVSFEELKFTSVENEFEFNQDILLDVLSIDWGSNNDRYPGWTDCVNISYKMRDLPSKMDLLTLDIDNFKSITLNEEQCKNQVITIEVSKVLDNATASLVGFSKDKKVFPAKIAIINEGEESAFVYELKNVMVTSYTNLKKSSKFTLEFNELSIDVEENKKL